MDQINHWQGAGGRRLARRTLLRSGALVLAGTGIAMTAGCGSKNTSTGKASTGAAKGAGTTGVQPVRGGVFAGRINTDPPTTWMPLGSITYIAVFPYAPAFNQLVQWDPQDPDKKIIPDLADSYEIAGDGRSIVFKLHPGVRFHDGSDFTSEDVKATIEWNKNPPPKMSSSQQGAIQVIDRVETPDPVTAKFILKAPSPSLFSTLASHFGCIGAKADLAKENLASIVNGTGPFKLKNYTRGVGVELDRNPSYWVKDRPYLDGIKYSIVFDENTAMANLIGGQFHKYFPVIADNVGRAARESGGKIVETSVRSPSRRTVFFNGTKKPFNDIRVRQAVSLVLDRQAAMLIDVQKPELGVAPGGYLVPGGEWANSTDQIKKVPGYDKPDIAEAKKLLAAAGVTEPLTGTLLTRSDTSFQPHAIYVQGTLLKALGWNFKIDVKDSASAFAAIAATQFDLIAWSYQPAADDPDATFGQLATAKAASNWSKISDAEADALFEKQAQTLDTAERKRLVQQLELKYLNNFPLLTSYFANSNHAIWNTFQNYKVPKGLYANVRFQDAWLNKA